MKWIVDYSILAFNSQYIATGDSIAAAREDFWKNCIKNSEEAEMTTIHSIEEFDQPTFYHDEYYDQYDEPEF